MRIEVPIESLHEIPLAYGKAIEKYKDENGDCWANKISLVHIEFEDNYRRTCYNCIFEVS